MYSYISAASRFVIVFAFLFIEICDLPLKTLEVAQVGPVVVVEVRSTVVEGCRRLSKAVEGCRRLCRRGHQPNC